MKFIPYPSHRSGVPGYRTAGNKSCTFVSSTGEEIKGNRIGALKCNGELNTEIDAYDGDEIFGGSETHPGIFTCFSLDGENIVCSGNTVEELAEEVKAVFRENGYYNVNITV